MKKLYITENQSNRIFNAVKRIFINESQRKRLFTENTEEEGVYVNSIKDNKAFLSYNKGSKINSGNLSKTNYLKTDKMDENNNNAYIVPLKGGINSYNITSIKGMEVMHYFKRLWDNKKTTIEIGDKDNKCDYELEMKQNEFEEFKRQFLNKISCIISYCMKSFQSQSKEKITKISIYPVKSTSNFNVKMAEEISNNKINGMPIQIISPELLSKDLRKLEKDEEFIAKNKEYYNSPFSQKTSNTAYQQPVISHVDKEIEKYNVIQKLTPYIEQMNNYADKIFKGYYGFKFASNKGLDTERFIKSMAYNYKKYYDSAAIIKKSATYLNPLRDNKSSRIKFDDIAKEISYSRGRTADVNRNGIIMDAIANMLGDERSPIDKKRYASKNNAILITKWEKVPFEIKNLTNSVRMGLKNIYNPSEDEDFLKQEVEKTKNSVFIIFDDNISGGATLSDICYQCKELGINYIIPITFGVMEKKETVGIIPLAKPIDNNGNKGFNY